MNRGVTILTSSATLLPRFSESFVEVDTSPHHGINRVLLLCNIFLYTQENNTEWDRIELGH